MKNPFYLRIKVIGVNLVDLLNKIKKLNIKIKNLIRTEQKTIEFDVEKKHFKSIEKEIIKNNNYEIIGNKTLDFKALITKNLILIICVAICLMLFLFSSAFIWQIKIYGAINIQKNEIINELKNNNVKIGKLFYGSVNELERLLLKNMEQVAQVSISKQGNALIVNITEKVAIPTSHFNPLISDYAGIITECNIIRGTALVKVGDYVNVGDVLVEPYIFDSLNQKIDIEPLAEIKAKIFIAEYSSINKNEIVYVRTGKIFRNTEVFIFNKKIFKTNTKKHFDYYETKVYNENISYLLPLKRKVFEHYELKATEKVLDLEAEKSGLIEKVKHEAYQKLGNATAIDEKITCEIIDDELFANCVISCEKYLTK